jgi:hypothetical protein
MTPFSVLTARTAPAPAADPVAMLAAAVIEAGRKRRGESTEPGRAPPKRTPDRT